MRASIALTLVCGIVLHGPGSAQEADQEAARLAQLALSAFECSALAADDKDAERLFLLGYDRGKEFIELATKNPLNQATRDKIAVLWTSSGGPTPDFILDRVYSEIVDIAYQDLGDMEHWGFQKSIRYQDKKCALIGR
jgi:hypothetical protein